MNNTGEPTPGPKEHVAEEVRAELARRRLSVNKLPQLIGKSQSYWERRTSGKIPMDVEDLAALADALQVKITSFFAEQQFGYCVVLIRPIGRWLTGLGRRTLLAAA